MGDIRERHVRVKPWYADLPAAPIPPDICSHCESDWPCDTAQETARADKAEAALAERHSAERDGNCAWCGIYLAGRQAAREHLDECPSHPLAAARSVSAEWERRAERAEAALAAERRQYGVSMKAMLERESAARADAKALAEWVDAALNERAEHEEGVRLLAAHEEATE